MRTTTQEALWVLRAQSGDGEALELLLRSIQPSLRRYLLRLVGRPHSDDVLQETLILVARKLAWLEDPELFRPWVFRIASRASFRYFKRERRWLERFDDETTLANLPAPLIVRPSGELLQQLATIDGISPASRAVLIMHFQEEMTLPEVAAILDIPLGTAKSRLAYGLAALRKHLGKE